MTPLDESVFEEGDGTGKWIEQLTCVDSDSEEDEYVYMTSDDDTPDRPQSLNVPISGHSLTARLIDNLPPEKRDPNAPLFTRPDHTVHRLIADIEDRADERHHRIPAFNQSFLPFPLMNPRPLSFSQVFDECGVILNQIRNQSEFKDYSGYRLMERTMVLTMFEHYYSVYQSIGLMYERAERLRHRWLLAQEWSLHQSVYPPTDLSINDEARTILSTDSNQSNSFPVTNQSNHHINNRTITELENQYCNGLGTLLSDALPIGLGHQTFHSDAQMLIDQVAEHVKDNNQPIAADHHHSDQTVLERINLDNLYCIGCHGYIPVHEYAHHLEACSVQAPLDEDVHNINLAPYTTFPPRPILPFLTSRTIHPAIDCEENLKFARMSEQHAWRSPAGEFIHFPSLFPVKGIVSRDYDKLFYARRELAIRMLREHEDKLNNEPEIGHDFVEELNLAVTTEDKMDDRTITLENAFPANFMMDENHIARPLLSDAMKKQLQRIEPSFPDDPAHPCANHIPRCTIKPK